MLSNILLGNFINTKSIIHKIDPRIKLIFNFIFVLLIFLSKSYVSFFILFFSVITIIYFTKISFKVYLKSLKAIIFFILITFFINAFFLDGTPIFKLGFLKITYEGLNISAIASIKLILLALISTTVLFVTSNSDLTLALEKLMAPLKFFKINVRDFATIITISLKFIPVLLEETNKLIIAHKARDSDINSGNIYQKAKKFSNILVTLFISSFKRADDLYVAMESRCYNFECKKTRMKTLKIKSIDIMSIFVIIIISLTVLFFNMQ